MTALPLITVGVVSFNRLRYLKALMTSARECLDYPNIQWIVVDGNSREAGLRDYIESLDWVQHKIFKTCTHAEAMNTILAETKGECLMLLPEDVQFVVRGTWLKDMAEVALANPSIGQVTFNLQRRITLRRIVGQAHAHIRFGRHRRFVKLPWKRSVNTYRSSTGLEFYGMGNMREGICGSGIMSFMRTEVWHKLGPWRTTNANVGIDSSLGAEDDMVLRYFQSGMNLETVLMRYCTNADVVTDMRGTKARVRGGNRRYGNYLAPMDGDLYYKLLPWADMERRFSALHPGPGFEDMVEPIGFPLPFDSNGNLLKNGSLDAANEPFELIF
jgi:glycosyltransferase involved in cell wall biosynthesis